MEKTLHINAAVTPTTRITNFDRLPFLALTAPVDLYDGQHG